MKPMLSKANASFDAMCLRFCDLGNSERIFVKMPTGKTNATFDASCYQFSADGKQIFVPTATSKTAISFDGNCSQVPKVCAPQEINGV